MTPNEKLWLLVKINSNLLETLEIIVNWDKEDMEAVEGIQDLALETINNAANDLRFGIAEKKEGE